MRSTAPARFRTTAVLFTALLGACDSPLPQARPLGELFNQGTWSELVRPRDDFGGLKVRRWQGRTVVLEVMRRPDGTSTRRVRALSVDGGELWSIDAAANEQLMDFTVHPFSGDVTVSYEVLDVTKDAFQLRRVSPLGIVRVDQPLPQPVTIPAAELGSNVPSAPFRMKSWGVDVLTDAWVRIEARDEDVVVAFTSLVTVADGQTGNNDLLTGVMSLGWTGSALLEQWARIVDGRHSTMPAAWTYDELRWREAAVRPLLAVDPDGGATVGRSWNSNRCRANAATFGEFTEVECRSTLPGSAETEWLPFAFSRFSAIGAREGTLAFIPPDAAEFIVFDLAVRGEDLAIVGAIVRSNEEGAVTYYPPSPGAQPTMTPYDGYLAVLDRSDGSLRFEHDVDTGRADYFSAARWTGDGLVAVGGADWDRWYGGMSISRGADPLLALFPSENGASPVVRTVPLGGTDRHHHLLSVDFEPGALTAVGLAEAPMTHSGDGGQLANMTFGGLRTELR